MLLIPNRRAMSAIVPKPSWAPIFALTVLIEQREGLAQTDGPTVRARRVARRPTVDRHRLVDDRVGRLHPGFERGEIDEQLERGSRLALGLGRAVVDRIDIVATADHRPHCTVAIDGDQRALGLRRRVGGDGAFRCRLHVGIERGPDLDRLGVLVDQGVELGKGPVGEIADAVLLGGRLDLDRRRIDLSGALGRDEAILDHRLEHDFRTVARGLDVGGRRIVGRRLHEAGDDRRLAERQAAGAVAEEAARGSVDAVGATAEIDAVEIELENLVLRELPLDRERKNAFLDLAAEGAAVGQEDVAGELLGDGRAALCPASGVDPDLGGANDADRVDAEMRAEALVLDRDHGGPHLRGDLLVRKPLPEAGPNVDQDGTVGGPDPDHLAKVGALRELGIAREVGIGDGYGDDQRK